jgi:hypothetical protein
LRLRPWFNPRWQRLTLSVLLVFALMGALPVWMAPEWPENFGNVNAQTQIRYEQQGFGPAVLPRGNPIPATISPNLPPSLHLLDGYQTGKVDRIAPGQFTANAQASVLVSQTHHDLYQIRTALPTTFNLLTAYFPGWRASVDNSQIPLQPDERSGLIKVSVPASRVGELSVQLESTPSRRFAWTISVSMLIVLLLLTMRRLRSEQDYFNDLDLLTVREARLVFVVLASFTLFIALFATLLTPSPLRARPGHALDTSIPLASRTDVGLEAMAFQLEKTAYRGGEPVDVTLFWRALRFLPNNYQVQVYLRDMNQGARWFRTAAQHPGEYPTRRWTTGQYVRDAHQISVSNSVVPGEYEIVIEVFSSCQPACMQGNRLTFFDQSGQLIGQAMPLPVKITILE